MPAICKCINGHKFTSGIVEDSPDINVLVVKASDEGCPECGTDDFEILEIVYDNE